MWKRQALHQLPIAKSLYQTLQARVQIQDQRTWIKTQRMKNLSACKKAINFKKPGIGSKDSHRLFPYVCFEIVIAPNTFDGGYFDKNNKVVNDDYLYFYYGDIFHFEHDFFNPNDLEQPDDYLYLEKPYLTLKNIGQGTAKDVQVIFSTDWIEDVVTELNSFEGKDEYKIINIAQGIGILHSYGNPNEGIVLPLSDGSDLTKSITYISSDDGSVNTCRIIRKNGSAINA